MADYDLNGGGYWGTTPDVIDRGNLPQFPSLLPNMPAPGNASNAIQGMYTKFLGRNANDQELQSHLGNPGGLGAVENLIANSPEADAYNKRNKLGDYATLPTAAVGAQNPPTATSVFDDPASSAWEKLLNDRIKQLQTPYPNPGFDQAIGQLNTYLQRLNGPAFTDAQMGVMQTQALDPLEQQRSAAKQQITQRMAAHGLGPNSGILEKALEDADQEFNALRTRTQAGFATNAIGLSNQNAATAAQIAPMIASLYQGQFNAQDQRSGQAAQLAGTIPMTAWERLMQANGVIGQTNPLSALQLQNGFQTQGYNQSADFANSLMQIVPYLLKAWGLV